MTGSGGGALVVLALAVNLVSAFVPSPLTVVSEHHHMGNENVERIICVCLQERRPAEL